MLTDPARTVAGTERGLTARDVTIDVSRSLAAVAVLLSAAVHLDLYPRRPAPDQSAPWG